MATVYLAQDLKHDRKVAIKVLRPELAAVIGADRFLAEIKMTANLQHPHILPLFDSGVADSFLFYVMPYIEGETLRDKLTREKQLPIGDAVRIASEVASALDYAHRHGVIHRDIKPENILLHDGAALVADFGIALAASKAGTRMTETGMSLGTPQYMSPEQAMGEREITARSDVYALGCVTYEMLSGEPPFSGPTAQAIVAKIMSAEPQDLVTLRRTIPAYVADAVYTSLQKLPADRFATAAAFAVALRSEVHTTNRPTRVGAATRASRFDLRYALPIVAAVAVIAFFLGSRLARNGTAATVSLGRATHLTWDPGLEVTPALSPDGKSIAYATGPLSRLHIVVRAVGEGRPTRLTGGSTDPESNPVWSADGLRVYFLSRGGAFSAPAGGGPAAPEIPGIALSPVSSVTPSPDGKRLAFTRGDSLLVREADQTVRLLATMREPALCSWSPMATFIACATGNSLFAAAGSVFGNLSPGRVTLCRVSDGHVTNVTDSLWLNTSPAWSPDGKELYFISDRDGQHDIYMLSVGGDGNAAGNAVRLSAGLGAHTISIAETGGRLAYSVYTSWTSIWSMPMPAHAGGTTTAAARVTRANEMVEQYSISVDGKWLYYDSDIAGNDDIFRIPTAGGEAERLTIDPSSDFAAVPSPDGKAFAFHSWRSGSRDIYVQNLDGSGVQRVTTSPLQEALPAWSPGGDAIGYSELSGNGGVWVVRRSANGTWGTPVRRLDHGSNVDWSPDGKWLVFQSTIRGGRIEVAPADSGPAHVVMDNSRPGMPSSEVVHWLTNNTLIFSTHDSMGTALLYTVPVTGGDPTLFIRFDARLHPAYRGNFVVRGNQLYFDSDDRQGDIWLFDLKRTP